MSSKLVYLAGPIDGCTFGECTDWRKYAIQQLAESGITGISPMRAKDFLGSFAVIKDGVSDHALATDRAITDRDKWDVLRSDAILFNLAGARKISVGTMIEYGWASSYLHKPIITIMEEGNVHNHPIVRGLTSFRAYNLEEGLQIVRALFDH